MTAKIIRFGVSAPQQPNERSNNLEEEQVKQVVAFTVGTDLYKATFRDGDLWLLSRTYYRIQGGRRTECNRHIDNDRDAAIVDAAYRALGHGPQAAAPEQQQELQAREVAAISRLDALKKLAIWISQQMKDGRVPRDTADAISVFFGPL